MGRTLRHLSKGHNYIGHNYIGHNYIGHYYVGHNCIACPRWPTSPRRLPVPSRMPSVRGLPQYPFSFFSISECHVQACVWACVCRHVFEAPSQVALDTTMGHNCVGHNYMGQHYVGHNYLGHNYRP